MSRGVWSIRYGRKTIVFALLRLPRKTMEIAVHPDQSVVVKAPRGIDAEDVCRGVRKRAGWIGRQRRYFEQFEPRTPPRRYVGGESHLYLGRKYRLKIQKAKTRHVALKNGYFQIHSPHDSPETIQALLETWYDQKALVCFQDVFRRCWEQFKHHDVTKPVPKIRKMKARWGSMSKNGVLTLNPSLIKAPRACVEYVVIHELCHLVHRHHDPAFYRLLTHSLPDWMRRKEKLEMALA